MPTSTQTSILGSLETKNILIGAWRWFAAPFDTYIDETTRFDTNNPPAPFIDLGASTEESSLSMNKQMIKYMSGVPSVIKHAKVTSLDFTVTFTLDQFSGFNLSRAIYGPGYAIKKFVSSPAIVLATAIPAGNIVNMTSSTGYIEGQYIALASSTIGLVNSIDEYRIIEISGNNLILDRNVSTVFASAPYVAMIESWKIPFGTSKTCQAAIVGCWDDESDGIQFVIAIPRAIIDGNFNGALPATVNAKIPLTVTGQAFYDVDLTDNVVANLLRFN